MVAFEKFLWSMPDLFIDYKQNEDIATSGCRSSKAAQWNFTISLFRFSSLELGYHEPKQTEHSFFCQLATVRIKNKILIQDLFQLIPEFPRKRKKSFLVNLLLKPSPPCLTGPCRIVYGKTMRKHTISEAEGDFDAIGKVFEQSLHRVS